jgi:hypothetical protein
LMKTAQDKEIFQFSVRNFGANICTRREKNAFTPAA